MRLALAALLAARLLGASEWRDPSPHTVGFAEVSGVRLHYLDWGGQGSVLLFLPGMGQSAHIFDGLAPHFTDSHHVIALTTRGQGKSGRPATGYDTRALVEDLRNFLGALRIDRVILAGHSMAGNELTEFALRYPRRVEKLIYIDAAYNYSQMPSSKEDPVKIEKPAPADLASIDAGMRWFERVFGFASPAVEADARDVNLKPDGTMAPESMPPDVARQLWQGMLTYKPDYKRMTAPILAIYAMSESHPFLRRDSPESLRQKGNVFWQSKWIPYQKQSIDQLLDATAPVRIVVLRNTQHLCFIRKSDEGQVVHAMGEFLR